MSAINGTPTPTPTPMPIPTVEELGPDCGVGVVLADTVVDEEGMLDVEDVLDVGDGLDVKDVDNVTTEALELEEAVAFDSTTKPRLVNVLPIKPTGLPVDVCCPVGSVSWNSKLGLIDSCFSSIPSFVPTVHT
jgi:hypothetical protein